MTTIQLTGGSYQSRALAVAAQRCVNLYPEQTPVVEGEPVQYADFPTPGLLLLGTAATLGWRCLYRASNGALYGVCGATVYGISTAWAITPIGTIPVETSICSMADNGINMIVVNGSTSGWSIALANNAFSPIVSPGFYGGTSVVYIDTYFVLNKPGTTIFYVSDSMAITFNPLNFASKAGYADPIQTVCVIDHQLWLIGTLTIEIWSNVGAPSFPFQLAQGVFIEHGTGAPYSVARQDNAVFFLSQDLAGKTVVLEGAGYRIQRISTHGVESALRSYATLNDAEAYCYQQDGHEFYILTFPTAGATWCYDRATSLWHERPYVSGGVESRHLSRVAASFNNQIVVGDYASGNLYALDINTFTDNGVPIKRLRSLAHISKDQKRIAYSSLIAIMQAGTAPDAGAVNLRWSDTRGLSWGTPISSSFGATGNYLTSVQFQQLGMARDRVFEISWTSPANTALLGVTIDAEVESS